MTQLPKDNQGYIKSFNFNQENEILDFFNKYGVVIIQNILDKQTIEKTIDEIWNHDELTSRGVRKNDKFTWERNWPMDSKIERKGWINTYDDLFYPMSWKNRFNPKLVHVFETIWANKLNTENTNLRVKTDRYGVMRPILNPKWKTDDGWLHTDQNPKEETEFCRLQGILALSDSTENTGGFICIPGFHKEWHEYCKLDRPDQHVCPFTSPKDPRAEKVFVRPGSLIIWDSRLPHCNYPNESKEYFRLVQYITYFPASQCSEKKKRIMKEDAQYINMKIKLKGLNFTEKQLQYLGFY